MDRFKQYKDKFEKFSVIDTVKREFKDTFPDTPQGRIDRAKAMAKQDTFDFQTNDEFEDQYKEN